MNKFILYIAFAFLLGGLFCSCDEDDDYSSKDPTPSEISNITKPVVTVDSRKANAGYDGWWVFAKVTTGNDDPSNVKCYLEWSKFASKQTGTISTFQHRDAMIIQSSSSSRVLFKKEHAGISRGTYIYFRLVGSNSKYTVTSPTEYMIATNY